MQTKSGSTVKANYSYLSDGTKASVLNASGTEYDYNGTFTYSHATGGTRTLESVAFGARRYDRSSWTSIDPLAEKYYSLSPYAYCAGNPVRFVDLDGKAWTPQYDMLCDGVLIGYTWVDEMDSYDEEGRLKEGLYHQAIFFSENGTFNQDSEYNIGSSTAYVYLSDGSIESFDACTHPSDFSKYPTIPEGLYEASVGKHRGSYTALKMYDVGKSPRNNTIELGSENPAYSDGRTSAAGINIHKAGHKNLTGKASNGNPVSAGCMLMDISRWDAFIGIF